MKSIIATKMSSMRKRSALSSSAASSSEVTSSRDLISAAAVPIEPSSHHGKMRLCFNDSGPPPVIEASNELVDIVLCIAVDSLHVVTDIDNSVVFEAEFASIKEIVWDHTDCSVCFVLDDGVRSPSFVFVSALVEVEAHLSTAVRTSGQQRLPEHVYVGVLVGRNLPTSPIHQRRASLTGFGAQQLPSLPATLRRELLVHERPPRASSPREKLAFQYFRTGNLSFPCSINGDTRGLKLDGNFLYVFPSPDSHDRSACLFSYQYDQVESCEIRNSVRLELRFRRSGAKQPTFIAFQSPDAQYIRDAIWFFQHDVRMEEYYRRVPSSDMDSSDITNVKKSALPPLPPVRRRNSLKSFQDADALQRRIQSRCLVIGCSRRCSDVTKAAVQDCMDSSTSRAVNGQKIWLCEEHAPVATEPGSPPRSPSKRSGLLSRGKSAALLSLLTQSKHYIQSVKYHGTLMKRGGKYQLTKAWNQKIVALIDTPLGGFLCYYDKLAHCPGQSDSAPKERRVIDLSGVICVRREGLTRSGAPAQPYAFDVVTVYRTWTFAASDIQEYEVWLSVLGEAIEKQSSMSPDTPLRFPVRCLRDPLHNVPSRNDGTTALEVSSNGVTVCSGTDGDSEVYNWYFTEIQKWSVAKQHDNTTCFFVSCAVDSAGPVTAQVANSSRYQDFLFQTPEAEAICSAIEFFVGRCMAKLEVLGLIYTEGQRRQSSRAPSLECASQKSNVGGAVDEKYEKPVNAKEYMLGAVPLRPVGLITIAPQNESIHQTPPELPQRPSQATSGNITVVERFEPPNATRVVPKPCEVGILVLDESNPQPEEMPRTLTPVETRSGELSSMFVGNVMAVDPDLSSAVGADRVLTSPLVSPPISVSSLPTSSAPPEPACHEPSASVENQEEGIPSDEYPHCNLEQGVGRDDSLSDAERDEDLVPPSTDSGSVVVTNVALLAVSEIPPASNDNSEEPQLEGHHQCDFTQLDGSGDSNYPPFSTSTRDGIRESCKEDSCSSSTAGNSGDASVECTSAGDETTLPDSPLVSESQVECVTQEDPVFLSSAQTVSDICVEGREDSDSTLLSTCQGVLVDGIVDSNGPAPVASVDAIQELDECGGHHGTTSVVSCQEVNNARDDDNLDDDSTSLTILDHVSDAVHESGDRVPDDSSQASTLQRDLPYQVSLLDEEPSLSFWPEGLTINNRILEEQADVDDDRFESFQYCECTVGVVEDVSSEGDQAFDEADDQDFADARSDVFDTAENSVVILDGCSGNDEESLVVLEDEDSIGCDVDTIGDCLPIEDPVDEIDVSLGGEENRLDDELELNIETIDTT